MKMHVRYVLPDYGYLHKVGSVIFFQFPSEPFRCAENMI